MVLTQPARGGGVTTHLAFSQLARRAGATPTGTCLRRAYSTPGSPLGATPTVVAAIIGANVGVFCLWQYLGPTFMVRNFAVSASRA
jgi:hypothetical protein